jgi:hypothetical protein
MFATCAHLRRAGMSAAATRAHRQGLVERCAWRQHVVIEHQDCVCGEICMLQASQAADA